MEVRQRGHGLCKAAGWSAGRGESLMKENPASQLSFLTEGITPTLPG